MIAFQFQSLNKSIREKRNKEKLMNRVYKVVKFTGKDCSFIPHNYSSTIDVPKVFSHEEFENLYLNITKPTGE